MRAALAGAGRAGAASGAGSALRARAFVATARAVGDTAGARASDGVVRAAAVAGAAKGGAAGEQHDDRDQREGGTLLGRAARFQLVSLVGAVMQWTVFIAGSVALFGLLEGGDALAAYLDGADGWVERFVRRPIVDPPAIGHGVYLAQLVGIGVATGWNYLANFYWTWRGRS